MAVNPIQVQKFLSGVDYPASKDDLVARAQQQGADDDVVSTLQELPGERFESPSAVSAAIGQLNW